MAYAWQVYGGMTEWERAPLYADARQRVLGLPKLSKYMDIIMSDYASEEDHLRWVIRGKVSEIVAWAETIRRDCE
jgi:hypothetical protein